jgi:ATP-dependent Clp protease ATP-binding subunit ClpC
MFERFTDKARRVLVIAQEEARTLEHPFIGPEHLLLGLARGEGVASMALNEAGLRYATLRERLAEIASPTPNARLVNKVPFSPQAKKTLELALREALQLGHKYIGTEHLLLGVLQSAENSKSRDSQVTDLIGDLATQLRGRVIELVSGLSARARLRSPALIEATNLARQLAGQAVMTTGHLLTALLADAESQASRALGALGVDQASLGAALAQVGVGGTSDAVPGPAIEIKFGDFSTTIYDLDISAALGGLTADEIRARLRRAFGSGPEHQATGSEG